MLFEFLNELLEHRRQHHSIAQVVTQTIYKEVGLSENLGIGHADLRLILDASERPLEIESFEPAFHGLGQLDLIFDGLQHLRVCLLEGLLTHHQLFYTVDLDWVQILFIWVFSHCLLDERLVKRTLKTGCRILDVITLCEVFDVLILGHVVSLGRIPVEENSLEDVLCGHRTAHFAEMLHNHCYLVLVDKILTSQ